MRINLLAVFFLILFTSTLNAQNNCANSVQLCNTTGITFPAATAGGAQAGPDYGCLGAVPPAPVWYNFQVGASGNINWNMTHSAGSDIDFIVYGPFANPTTPCTSQLTAANTVDCSFAVVTPETPSIIGAVAGQYYIMMVSNWGGAAGTISLNSTVGTVGSVSCGFSVQCPPNMNVSVDSSCTFTIPDYTPMATATMANGAVSYTQTPAPGTVVSANTTITIEGTDATPETSMCSFQIFVNTSPDPIWDCLPDQILGVTGLCSGILPDYLSMTTVATPCATLNVAIQIPPAGTVITGPTSVTLAAQNSNNQVGTCVFTVTPAFIVTDTVYVNSGDNYTFPSGNTFMNITTPLMDSLTVITGGTCDSILVTQLLLNSAVFGAEMVEVCSGDDYTFPDGTMQTNITAQVMYVSTLVGAGTGGIDSIVTTTVNVNPTYNVIDNETVCFGGDYTFPDGTVQTNITAQVMHVSMLSSVDMCDSIINTTVDPDPILSSTEMITLCSGSDYTFPDGSTQMNLNADVNYTSMLNTAAGCDSNVVTMITINPIYNVTESVNTCFGGDYTFPDGTVEMNITAQVVHVSNLQTANMCDSIITTTLNPNAVLTTNETMEVCSGDDYTFPDGSVQMNITAQVMYTSTLTTLAGCDSIVNTTVDVNPVFNMSETVAVCSGDDYTFPDGSTQTNIMAQVMHTSMLLTTAMCDSIIVTTVNVNPVYNISESASICPGDNYTFPDGSTQMNINSQVVYTSNLSTNLMCDSIIVTTVNITPVINVAETMTVCSGDSYTFPDGTTQLNITAQVVYASTLTAASTCDSVVTTTVNVNPVYTTPIIDAVCSGDSYTFPDGSVQMNITAQVVQNSALLSVDGCDSTVITTVNVNPNLSTSETMEVCSGDGYVFPDGSMQANITAQVVYVSSLMTQFGCDSIVTTTVDVNPTYSQTDTATICSGDDYTFHNGVTFTNITAPTSQVSSLLTGSMCDSVITTYINVNPVFNQSETDAICSGDDYTFPDGSTQINITSQVIYTSNLTTVNGCDSVIVTTVNLYPEYDIMVTDGVCDGGDYTFPDGTTQTNITAQVIYTSNLLTTEGCDSVITTTVNVNPNYNVSEAFVVCEGDDYTYPDGSISTNITVPEMHVSNLLSQFGCDSIVTTSLTVGQSYMMSFIDTVCSTSDYTFPDGTIQNNIQSDVTYTSVLPTVNGCDSTITISLVVVLSYNYSVSASLCNVPSFTLPDGTVVTIAGTYPVSYTTFYGCDSTIVTDLTADNTGELNPVDDIIVCDGFTEIIQLDQLGLTNFEWFVNEGSGFVPLIDSTNYAGADEDALFVPLDVSRHQNVYLALAQDDCGNVYRDTIVLEVYEPQPLANPINDTSFCNHRIEPITVNYNGGSFEWSDGGFGPSLLAQQSGDYYLTFIENGTNCIVNDTINVRIDNCIDDCVGTLPTAFSPNGDGMNDVFQLIETCEEGFSEFNLEVYDFWGELIFRTNDHEVAWDGTFKGRIQEIGSYAFKMNYTKEITGESGAMDGNVTIIK